MIKRLINKACYKQLNHVFFSLFFKGFVHISKELSKNISDVEDISKELESASDCFHYKAPKCSQYYQVVTS